MKGYPLNIMLDLETLGVLPGCAIRSIGAVTFELNANGKEAANERTFYANISARSCLYARLHIEQGTDEWWNRQSPEALEGLKTDQKPLAQVATEFNTWCTHASSGILSDIRLWCQGANFDAVIWEFASRAVALPTPWKFYNVRDTRTLYALADFDPRSLPRAGTYHNALDDARHQAACCRAAWAKLKGTA